jgi:hypothetical protein
MAGLPRWAWLLILASGLIIGLFLRQRNLNDAAGNTDQQDTSGDTTGDTNLPLEYADPSLNATAVPAGGAGVTIPVETPMIPQGYDENFGALVTGIVDIATTASDNKAGTAQTALENPPTAGTTPPTGGGPPPKPPAKLPPKPKVTKTRKVPRYKVEKTRKAGKGKNAQTQYYWHGNWHTSKPPEDTQYFWSNKWHDHPPHQSGTRWT